VSHVDQHGNSFHPNKVQLTLLKSGWQLVDTRKKGMLKIVRWRHPDTAAVWSQCVALEIEKLRKRSAKILEKA
jgi:hypothetical protein